MAAPDAGTHLVRHLRQQAVACGALGSPFYARLLDLAALDAERGGTVASVLGDYDNRADDAVPLRLLGAVHRLVLSGAAPALVPRYPNVGGDGDADAAWPAFLAVVVEHRAAVLDVLTRAPQTNEPGRAAGLLGVLHRLVAARDLPVRLLEIGASGGLNLRADGFRVTRRTTSGGGASEVTVAGPDDSPVVFTDGWTGRVPAAAPVRVVERVGCDVAPVDPTTEEGALTLQSYVWPDQRVRWQRLQGAIEVARATPARLVRVGAAEFLADVAPTAGHWTVVWHSVMWQYVDPAEQRRVLDLLAGAGAAAGAGAPVAHVSLEPYGDRFLVTARTWPPVDLGADLEVLPDGQSVVAVGAPHGVPVHWV